MADSTHLAAARQRFNSIEFGAFLHLQDNLTPGVIPNVTAWMTSLRAAGCQGVCITALHQSVFALWNSTAVPYNSVSAGNGDVQLAVCNAARAAGMGVGLYLGNATSQDDTGKAQKLACIAELLGGTYGTFDWLFYEDNYYGSPTSTWVAGELAAVSAAHPSLLWMNNERVDANASSQVVPFEDNLTTMSLWDAPGRSVGTVTLLPGCPRLHALNIQGVLDPAFSGGSNVALWFYNASAPIRSLQDLRSEIALARQLGCTIMLNIPPKPDGTLSATQMARWAECVGPFIDLARGKTCTASSTYSGSDITLLTNGTNWYGVTPFNTDVSDNTPWVKVDLGAAYQCDGVSFWNVGGGYDGRMTEYTVTVYDANNVLIHSSAVLRHNPTPATYAGDRIGYLAYQFPTALDARYVRVQRNAANVVGLWAYGPGGTEATPHVSIVGFQVFGAPMDLQKGIFDGVPVIVDGSAPTVIVTDATNDGGDVIMGVAKILHDLRVAIPTSNTTRAVMVASGTTGTIASSGVIISTVNDVSGVNGLTVSGTATSGTPGIFFLPSLGANAIAKLQVGIDAAHAATLQWDQAGAAELYFNANNKIRQYAGGCDFTVGGNVNELALRTEAVYLEVDLVMDAAGKTVTMTTGTNACAGTVTLNGATPVAVSTTAITDASTVRLEMLTPAGTLGAHPRVTVATPGSGFSVAGTALDVSIYGWYITKLK